MLRLQMRQEGILPLSRYSTVWLIYVSGHLSEPAADFSSPP
jgi:hypothetical protein